MTQKGLDLLDTQRVGYLATVDERGRPHVVPICYAYVEGVVYSPVDEKPKRADPLRLRRIRNLLLHPEVCLLVDRYDEDWSRLAWMQIHGVASLVTDPFERARAIEHLRVRYPQYRTMALEDRPLIRIEPRRVVLWSAGTHSPTKAERSSTGPA
jgi:PPOX class probable F420-dependent enzyme